jgi:hypothetical protein
MDPRGSQIPTQVLESKREGHVHLVQYFDQRERGDRGRSWNWVMAHHISPLGIDLDEDRKRVRTKRRKSVKQAYIDACGLKGIDPTLVLAD